MLVSLLQSNKWRPKWHQNVTTSSQPIFRRLATSNEEHVKKPSNQVVTNRPNLKRAGKSGNPKVVIVGCILVALYMYPMIFKPMFSIGISGEFLGLIIRTYVP